jgi:hypothetical protein
MRFLYTDRLQLQTDFIPSCLLLCKQCKMSALARTINEFWLVAETRKRNWIDIDLTEHRFHTILIPTLKDDLNMFVRSRVIPRQLRNEVTQATATEAIAIDRDDGSDTMDAVRQAFPDLILTTHRIGNDDGNDDDTSSSNNNNNNNNNNNHNCTGDNDTTTTAMHRFLGHRLMINKQSEYLAALQHYHELRDSGSFHVVDTDASSGSHKRPIDGIASIQYNAQQPLILAYVVEYFYSSYISNVQDIDVQALVELLHAGHQLLAADFVTYIVNHLVSRIESTNVLDLYELADFFVLRRLEESCVEVIAMNLERLVSVEQFESLVLVSASAIKNRQETDSIPIIDDIENAITAIYWFDPKHQEHLRGLLAQLLHKLQLKRAPTASICIEAPDQ